MSFMESCVASMSYTQRRPKHLGNDEIATYVLSIWPAVSLSLYFLRLLYRLKSVSASPIVCYSFCPAFPCCTTYLRFFCQRVFAFLFCSSLLHFWEHLWSLGAGSDTLGMLTIAFFVLGRASTITLCRGAAKAGLRRSSWSCLFISPFGMG